MITIYNRDQEARLHHILRDYDAANAGVQLILTIGGIPYDQWLERGDIGYEQDSTAITLDSELSMRPPTRLKNAPIRIAADIDGIIVPMMYGRVSIPRPTDQATTELFAASPGTLLDKVKMRPNNTTYNITEYNGMTPTDILRDALYRVPYNRSRVKIAPFDYPTMYFMGDEGFEDEAVPQDVISAIQEQIGCLVRDTPDLGVDVIAQPYPGSGEVVWDYEISSKEVILWQPPALKTPDEQYTEVVVRDRGESGAYRIYAEMPVDYSTWLYPPAAGQTLYIPYLGAGTYAGSEAASIAYSMATNLRYGVYEGDVSVVFNPLLQRGDIISFGEDYWDDEGEWRREWRAVITAMRHTFDDGLETILTCEFVLVSEEFIPPTPIMLPKVSPAVGSTGVAALPYGISNGRLWIDRDKIEGPMWAQTDGATGRLVIDTDLAPGLFLEELGRLYLNI